MRINNINSNTSTGTHLDDDNQLSNSTNKLSDYDDLLGKLIDFYAGILMHRFFTEFV